MVYIDSFDDFLDKAEMLYRANPLKTRYVVKYRHCEGKLVLKVTDDVVCLKYKTDQAQDLKKMERLNNLFFTLMACGLDEPVSAVPMETAPSQAAAQPSNKKSRGRRQ